MRRGCAGNGTCEARRSTRHVPVQVGGRWAGAVAGAGLIAASLGQGRRRGGAQRRVAWAHAHENGCTRARGQSFAMTQRRASARHSKRARDKTDARPAAARRACARVRPLSGLQFGMRAPSPSGGRWQNPPCVDRGFPMGHDRQSLKAFRWALRTPLRRPRLPNGPRSTVTQGFPMGLEDPHVPVDRQVFCVVSWRRRVRRVCMWA